MPVSPEDIISRSDKIAQRMFDERMLVITAKDSMLHRFDEVGTHIWNVLDKPLSVKELCLSIEDTFEGFDRRKSFSEITNFLELLEKKSLIAIVRNTRTR